jgi:hypothetical protein
MMLLALLPLEVDPNVVKPGWTPLIITILLALAMVGLFVSMRRQFRKIDANRASDEQAATDGADELDETDGPDGAEQPGENKTGLDSERRSAAGPT